MGDLGDYLDLVNDDISDDGSSITSPNTYVELSYNSDDIDTDQEMFDVNTVIEKTGWGKYQRRVVLAMGFMSFADAAEIWLATIILNDLQCEWELSSAQKALVPAIVYIFYAFGSIVAGKMADKFGRFPILLINGYLIVISAVCSALAPNYNLFISCRALTGLGIGASYGCSIVYTAELMPTAKRSWGIFILEAYWVVGGLYECLMAYFVMDLPSGWRIQILLTAVPCVVMLISLHFLDESPRYLVINDKRAEAMKVIEKICKENKVEVPTGKIYCSDERSGGYKDVWAKPQTWGSIQISIHYFCNMFLVFGLALLVPDMMYRNYCDMSSLFETTYTNSEGCLVYTKAEYLFLIGVAVSYAPGLFAGTVGAETIGRRWTFIISIYTGAMFTFLLLICADSIFTYIILFTCSFAYGTYNQVLWIYTPEFYPTYMRATAIGVQNGIGKIGAAFGSFITEYIDDMGIRYTVLFYIGLMLIACMTICFMERETKGTALVDRDERVDENTRLSSR